MLQKAGQISKTTEISPVLYVQPFHTCCLTCNRRQSLSTAYQGRYSRKNVTETNTKYKLEAGDGEKLKHSHIANKLSTNLLRRTQCLPQKSFLAITFITTSQQTQWLKRNMPEADLFSYLGSSNPYKNFSQPRKDLSVSEQRSLTFEQRFCPKHR